MESFFLSEYCTFFASLTVGEVLIDGLDETLSVENDQQTTKVHEGSKMIVIFDKWGSDVNDDEQVNINDVVALVKMISGQ